MDTPKSRLSRSLSFSDAYLIGIASMIGAGIFSSLGPAFSSAGYGILLSLLLAFAIALLNSLSVSQLAVVYPESGGAYIYGRNLLGPLWGFLAGFGFIIGKISSCAAMAMTFSLYLFPEWSKPLAIASVVTLVSVNYFGIKKTALLTRALLAVVLFSLIFFVITQWIESSSSPSQTLDLNFSNGIGGILQASGILFFAFAGYARIATLAEEVANPSQTLPRAMIWALVTTLTLYFLVILSCLINTDLFVLQTSSTPLKAAIEMGAYSKYSYVVQMGACFGSLGVLLSLLAGVSRTLFSMASNGDMPKFFSRVHPTHLTPAWAEIFIGALVSLMLIFADLKFAISLSSFSILVYYSIANISALKLKKHQRTWGPWISRLGALACLGVAFSLPYTAVVSGLGLFLIGSLIYKAKSWHLSR